jgi:hypothetical protein
MFLHKIIRYIIIFVIYMIMLLIPATPPPALFS